MSPKFVALLLIVAVLAAAGLRFGGSGHPRIDGDLRLQRIDGKVERFDDYRGKPLLVTFWSPTCASCMHEVEDLNHLYQQGGEGESFALLGLSMYYDRPDMVIAASTRAGMQYPVYLDLQRELSRGFGQVRATPTSFLVDAQGEIAHRHEGKLDFALIRRQLNELSG